MVVELETTTLNSKEIMTKDGVLWTFFNIGFLIICKSQFKTSKKSLPLWPPTGCPPPRLSSRSISQNNYLCLHTYKYTYVILCRSRDVSICCIHCIVGPFISQSSQLYSFEYLAVLATNHR